MGFKIRTASAEDVPAMHQLRLNVRENRLLDPTRITEASYPPYILAGSAWVAETDDRIVGFGVVDAPGQRIEALFVEPRSEGAGIGLALHQQMLEWAQEVGLTRLSLSTEDGSRAVSFYEKAGWQRSGFTAEGEVLLERCVKA
jgi:GNAT superfamily N-acetyltransferase